MRKWLLLLPIIALLAAAGGWYYASPMIALKGLETAAREGDEAQLRERVDFAALRESVKTQVRTRLTRELDSGDLKDNPFGKLGGLLAMGMVDGVVDEFVTPEAISRLVLQQKSAAASAVPAPGASHAPQPSASSGPSDHNKVAWAIRRDGLDRFRLVPKDGFKGPDLLFVRHGLSWDLVGIDFKDQPVGQPQ